VKRSDLKDLTRQDLQQVMECMECGEFFDARNMNEVIFHAFGHQHGSNTEYGSVMKLKVCADCDATMHFVRRRWGDFVGFWKCARRARIEWAKQTPRIWKPGGIRFA
jgi:hypothetical protein